MMNKSTFHLPWLTVLVASTAMIGCSSKPAAPSTDQTASDSNLEAGVAIVEAVEPKDVDRQAMVAAKDMLFQKLSGRLMQAMGEQGPAAAIAVCQQEAAQIAAEVGQANGLSIGRTGVRLRNPKNQPPDWAKSLTEKLTDRPTFVKLTNGHAAALLPIKLQSQCLMCHGPKEQIAPVISEQLARLYPEDQATGFQEGELRGWFWIEKPSS